MARRMKVSCRNLEDAFGDRSKVWEGQVEVCDLVWSVCKDEGHRGRVKAAQVGCLALVYVCALRCNVEPGERKVRGMIQCQMSHSPREP